MRVRLTDMGRIGIVTDRPDHELPVGAWSDGNNVVFRDGWAAKIPGDSEVYASPSIRPSWTFSYKDPVNDNEHWIYAGWDDSHNAKIYSVTASTHTHRTRKNADAAISAIVTGGGNIATVTIASTTYVDGDEVIITGSDSTPDIDGTWTVSKTSATEFDIDIGAPITVSGTTGTASLDSNYNWTPTGITLHSNLPIFTTTVLNGLPILNCSSDKPQKWDRTAGALNTKMEDLANWPATWSAKSVRAFRGFLFAMDIDDSANTPSRNPYRVAWSDVIDTQFTEPSTWTAAASNLAGDVFLTDTDGYVQDAIELRGNLIVFKDDATYLCSYVGGNAVFSFRLLFNKHGLLAPNCMAKVKGERVFFVTQGDIMVTDGNTAESIADSRVREKIFGEIDSTYYQKGGAFCVEHYAEEEIWFCYSRNSNNALADTAAIWNYETGAWSFRDLENCPCIASGFVELPGGSWDGASGSWDAQTRIWDQAIQSPGTDSLLIVERGDTDTTASAKFLLADDSYQFDDVNMTAYLTRTGLDIVGDGVPQQSPPLVKYCRRLYPKIHGGPVQIKMGYSMNEAGPYTWLDPVTYDPTNGDHKVDLRVTGRYFGLDIRSTGNVVWELNSLDAELEVVSDGR